MMLQNRVEVGVEIAASRRRAGLSLRRAAEILTRELNQPISFGWLHGVEQGSYVTFQPDKVKLLTAICAEAQVVAPVWAEVPPGYSGRGAPPGSTQKGLATSPVSAEEHNRVLERLHTLEEKYTHALRTIAQLKGE